MHGAKVKRTPPATPYGLSAFRGRWTHHPLASRAGPWVFRPSQESGLDFRASVCSNYPFTPQGDFPLGCDRAGNGPADSARMRPWIE